MSNRKRLTFELVDFWCHRIHSDGHANLNGTRFKAGDLVVNYVKMSGFFHEFVIGWKWVFWQSNRFVCLLFCFSFDPSYRFEALNKKSWFHCEEWEFQCYCMRNVKKNESRKRKLNVWAKSTPLRMERTDYGHARNRFHWRKREIHFSPSPLVCPLECKMHLNFITFTFTLNVTQSSATISFFLSWLFIPHLCNAMQYRHFCDQRIGVFTFFVWFSI